VSGRSWQTIREHTDEVVFALEGLIENAELKDSEIFEALLLAARWHDAGKAHHVFQNAVPKENAPENNVFWGKSKEQMKHYERPGFRHELASAIAMLQNGQSDLAAYLAASHHGKVRMSIRSLPHEKHPENDTQGRFARGVWDGDALRGVYLGGGVSCAATMLDLSYMELGDGPRGLSWLARNIALREKFGPFRLAYMEALMRVADWRGSQAKGVRDE